MGAVLDDLAAVAGKVPGLPCPAGLGAADVLAEQVAVLSGAVDAGAAGLGVTEGAADLAEAVADAVGEAAAPEPEPTADGVASGEADDDSEADDSTGVVASSLVQPTSTISAAPAIAAPAPPASLMALPYDAAPSTGRRRAVAAFCGHMSDLPRPSSTPRSTAPPA